jgi:glyoxylase-like metal-dependent hydrolase (beta-lactamase superfamily II)
MPITLNTFDAPQRRLDPQLDVPAPPEGWTWPPTSVTLIAGEREAVLVDTLPTVADSQALGDWIEATGRVLTAIYITHGHLDHYLGAQPLLERFPGVRMVATGPTIRDVENEVASGAERAVYSTMFIDELVSTVVVPEALEGDRLELEGHEIIVVPTGQSDHADSSYVHLPELQAVIVGDIAYNDVHCALMETDHARRLQWIETIKEVQALDPKVVMVGHRRAGAPDDPRILADTIAYLEEADRLLQAEPDAADFVGRMLRSHPNRLNAGTVMFGAAFLGLT